MASKICYWEYNDGWSTIHQFLRRNEDPARIFNEHMVGWSCWVYTSNIPEFLEWMSANMKYRYDATQRFNGGDVMCTVFIANDEDAALFKLKWG